MTRYRLDLPMTFRWKDPQGREQVGSGFTHNVSAVAIFVFSSDLPPLNEVLHCELKLPRLRDTGCVPLTVSGRVVRVDQGADWRQNGFVVLGEMLRLCNQAWPDKMEEMESVQADAPSPSKRPN